MLDEKTRLLYTKWERIEQEILSNKNIPIKILKELQKAYKDDTTQEEQEQVINSVYNKLFANNMEV